MIHTTLIMMMMMMMMIIIIILIIIVKHIIIIMIIIKAQGWGECTVVRIRTSEPPRRVRTFFRPLEADPRSDSRQERL